MEVDLVLKEEANIDELVMEKNVICIDEIKVIAGELVVTTEVVGWRKVDVVDCAVEVEVTTVVD